MVFSRGNVDDAITGSFNDESGRGLDDRQVGGDLDLGDVGFAMAASRFAASRRIKRSEVKIDDSFLRYRLRFRDSAEEERERRETGEGEE
jgi:hypothetical protein